MIKQKRKKIKRINSIFLSVICLISTCGYSCKKDEKEKAKETDVVIEKIQNDKFFVSYLNVGMGDAIFINFGNGKNMLIDTGPNSEFSYNAITNVLSTVAFDGIDYLLLTHPDNAHTGNAQRIINEYNVKKLFYPFVKEEIFPDTYSLIENAKEKKIDTYVTDCFQSFREDEENVYFLYPNPVGVRKSVYNDDFDIVVSEKDANKLSAITLIEYKEIRFLFMADAVKDSEEFIKEYYDSALYNTIFNKDIKLNEIDFLKIANHGATENTTSDFLNFIKPKNAIISVGGNNNYGYPALSVIDRLYGANENVRILRTDVHGTITVFVNDNGGTNIVTDDIKK